MKIHLPAWSKVEDTMDDEIMNETMAPWERLAGREWNILAFFVTFGSSHTHGGIIN